MFVGCVLGFVVVTIQYSFLLDFPSHTHLGNFLCWNEKSLEKDESFRNQRDDLTISLLSVLERNSFEMKLIWKLLLSVNCYNVRRWGEDGKATEVEAVRSIKISLKRDLWSRGREGKRQTKALDWKVSRIILWHFQKQQKAGSPFECSKWCLSILVSLT